MPAPLPTWRLPLHRRLAGVVRKGKCEHTSLMRSMMGVVCEYVSICEKGRCEWNKSRERLYSLETSVRLG